MTHPDLPRRSFRVGLIGDGVRPSLTPPMHEEEAARLGLDYRDDVIDLLELGKTADDIGGILNELEAAGYDAVNVTHPVKQAIIPLLHELSDEAATIGAVNLVRFVDGRRIGGNTDVSGFASALASGLGDARLDRVVQFGAGGAGAATAYALLQAGTERLTIVDTRLDSAADLAARYGDLFGGRIVEAMTPDDAADALTAASGALNATPVGMFLHPGLPFDVHALGDGTWIADVVYRPVRTQLLQEAEARGLRTLDGGRMAVGQAVDSMRLITGVEPDETRMYAHFQRLLETDDLAVG